MEVLGNLVTSEVPEEWTNVWKSLISSFENLPKKIIQGEVSSEIIGIGIYAEEFSSVDL